VNVFTNDAPPAHSFSYVIEKAPLMALARSPPGALAPALT